MKKVIEKEIEKFRCSCGCVFESDEWIRGSNKRIPNNLDRISECPKCKKNVYDNECWAPHY